MSGYPPNNGHQGGHNNNNLNGSQQTHNPAVQQQHLSNHHQYHPYGNGGQVIGGGILNNIMAGGYPPLLSSNIIIDNPLLHTKDISITIEDLELTYVIKFTDRYTYNYKIDKIKVNCHIHKWLDKVVEHNLGVIDSIDIYDIISFIYTNVVF